MISYKLHFIVLTFNKTRKSEVYFESYTRSFWLQYHSNCSLQLYKQICETMPSVTAKLSISISRNLHIIQISYNDANFIPLRQSAKEVNNFLNRLIIYKY